MKVIEADGLSFKYRRAERPSLQDVSFSVRKGEMVGVIGPSGSGKSTLCLTLNGIIPNSIKGDFKGTVIVRNPLTGEEFSTLETPVSKLSTVVGLVLQNPESQLFNMTVEEEVAFGPESLGLPRDEVLERVRWALGVTGLSGLEDEFPPNLSGGQQQRLAIAAILAMKPSILVLDEPTSQLDPRGKREVLNLVSALRREHGMTVVLVEHNTDYLFRTADRIVVMNRGSVFMEGTPREIAERADDLMKIGVKLPASVEISAELKKRGLAEDIALTPDELPALTGFPSR
ncbi:energy-coupling factor ABC transporter ATP-binding protein [Thermococcus sp.]|uniref:energy-coupling factor ABC transporter ATP-binding protein n=1 Tax=Thermococcus sp. TaxID=35749 RepID=UPI002603DBED|nr:ATP-binding cassette domain-containing protein [Thermococcus sp.]